MCPLLEAIIVYTNLSSRSLIPRLTPPDHSYFDSVSTQLELSVVSLFSGGREKEHLPNKVDKSYRIVCDQFGTPTEAYDEEGKETQRWLII